MFICAYAFMYVCVSVRESRREKQREREIIA